MTHALLTPDPDPADRQRACDLGDVGLPGFGAFTAIGADGEEYLMLCKYGIGVADGRVLDWRQVAPHEQVGVLPSPWRYEQHQQHRHP